MIFFIITPLSKTCKLSCPDSPWFHNFLLSPGKKTLDLQSSAKDCKRHITLMCLLILLFNLCLEKAWKRMVTKVCYVGEGFTRKPPKYERFIRPMVRNSNCTNLVRNCPLPYNMAFHLLLNSFLSVKQAVHRLN